MILMMMKSMDMRKFDMVVDEIIEKVRNLEKCYIPHFSIEKVFNKIEECMSLSQVLTEPMNILLIGEAGTGKTTVCNKILKKYERQTLNKKDRIVTLIPAFYTSIPNPVTIKGVASAMLASLGDPAPNRGSANELTMRIGKLLKECQTKVILLDELQHLLIRDLGKRNDVSDWLKSIINNFNVPIVVVGMPNCESIIDQDKQLSRRFSDRFELVNLEYIENKKCEFKKFLFSLISAYTQIAKLKSYPDFRLKHYCLALYTATGGNPGDLVKLVRRATVLAITKGRNTIGICDFAEIYSCTSFAYSKPIKSNPFECDLKQLNKELLTGKKLKVSK